MKTYQVDKNGYLVSSAGPMFRDPSSMRGKFTEYLSAARLESDSFKEEFDQLLRDYVGRPSPLLGQTVEREIRMQYLFETGRLEPYRST